MAKKPKRNPRPVVGWVVGSGSDLPVMEKGLAVLRKLEISHEILVASAHRSPDRVEALARQAEKRGWTVLVASAGMANHLAGSFAARTRLPVIGLPLAVGSLGGLDSLLSTVQMPPGVPVATVSLGEAGAVNAAVFAARILALSDPSLAKRLSRYAEALGGSSGKK